MAIILEANYAKRLGLPGYSSHQFSVTVRTELSEVAQVEQECRRLYRLLQDAVDQEIQKVGFVPDATYGMKGTSTGSNGDNCNDHRHHRNDDRSDSGESDVWRCSDKQRELIERLVAEKHLDKNAVEALAQSMFGAGVRQLNRLEASGLIDELLERHRNGNGRRLGGNSNHGGGNGYYRARERRFERSASQGGGAE